MPDDDTKNNADSAEARERRRLAVAKSRERRKLVPSAHTLTFRQQDMVRAHISTIPLLKRVQNFALASFGGMTHKQMLKNKNFMLDSQIRAAGLLLAKVLPDLARVEHQDAAGLPLEVLARVAARVGEAAHIGDHSGAAQLYREMIGLLPPSDAVPTVVTEPGHA